jgi:hypothetical protein
VLLVAAALGAFAVRVHDHSFQKWKMSYSPTSAGKTNLLQLSVDR